MASEFTSIQESVASLHVRGLIEHAQKMYAAQLIGWDSYAVYTAALIEIIAGSQDVRAIK